MEWIKLIFDTMLVFVNAEFTLFDTYTISFMDILIASLLVTLVCFLITSLAYKD